MKPSTLVLRVLEEVLPAFGHEYKSAALESASNALCEDLESEMKSTLPNATSGSGFQLSPEVIQEIVLTAILSVVDPSIAASTDLLEEAEAITMSLHAHNFFNRFSPARMQPGNRCVVLLEEDSQWYKKQLFLADSQTMMVMNALGTKL
eukprot:CAMPEP_0175113178 /NCGR_PEP_ID=MMETSP0086_2-20121207/15994_1 /TAXON_ID=136419 /ORGANISM="Unknown Unknown, Strain D1" /LENGTH=148 /DNA_ID=CAMNT_0016392363 /DNA_START=43 /DNA_END=489 /DNA_ORIENTATION=+